MSQIVSESNVAVPLVDKKLGLEMYNTPLFQNFLKSPGVAPIKNGVAETMLQDYILPDANYTSLTFDIIPASNQHLLSNDVVMKFNYVITINGGKKSTEDTLALYADKMPYTQGGCGIAQLGICNIIRSLALRMNNATITREVEEYIHALNLFNDNKDSNLDLLYSMPDFDQTYVVSDNYDPTQLNNPSPLYGYIESAGYVPRSIVKSVSYYSSATPTVKIATLNDTVIDGLTLNQYIIAKVEVENYLPIPLSLFVADGVGAGIANLRTCQLVVNLSTDYSKLLSISKGTVDSVSFEWGTDKPRVTVKHLLPPSYLADPIRAENGNYVDQYYPFTSLSVHKSTKINVPGSGVITNQSTTQFSLSRVPDAVIFYLERNRATTDNMTADQVAKTPVCFAGIRNFSMTFNGQASIFKDYTEYDLYKMSKDNGLAPYSYHHWKNTVGAVIYIDFSKDVGIRDLLVGEGLASSSLTFKFDAVNLDSNAHNFTPTMLVLNNGYIVNTSDLTTQIFDAINVEHANKVLLVEDMKQSITNNVILGAGFWDVIKKGAKGLWNVIKKPAETLATSLLNKGVNAIQSKLGGRYTIAGNQGGSSPMVSTVINPNNQLHNPMLKSSSTMIPSVKKGSGIDHKAISYTK